MKKLSSIIFALLFTCTVTLKITNIQTSDGTIVISIHDSDVSFSKRIPLETLHLNPESPYITYTLDLPDGEYAFCVFHDTNNDNDLNSNRLGIPKEPFVENEDSEKVGDTSFEHVKASFPGSYSQNCLQD